MRKGCIINIYRAAKSVSPDNTRGLRFFDFIKVSRRIEKKFAVVGGAAFLLIQNGGKVKNGTEKSMLSRIGEIGQANGKICGSLYNFAAGRCTL